jgi:hypothetical protein
MSESISLRYPIQIDGVQIKWLPLRRVIVADLEMMNEEKTELAKSIRLVSLVTEMAPDDIRRLDAADFNQISDQVSGFLE